MAYTLEDFKAHYEADISKWDDVIMGSETYKFSSVSSSGRFLKLTPRSDPYIIRVMTVPKVTRRHWEVFKPERYFPISPALNLDLMEADVAWSLGGWKPSTRFTTLVMDRETDSPRIMDFGRQLFESFVMYMQSTGIDPAGKDSPDFKLYVENSGGGPIGREIRMTPLLTPMPLTDFEMASAATLLKTAADCTRSAKPADIRDMWMKLPIDRKYSPKAKAVTQERPGCGKSSPDAVMSYIEKYGDSIFVPVLDHGKVTHAKISEMSKEWIEAYSSFYIDFGLKPNRYREEGERNNAMLDEIAEALELKWTDPNE